MDSKDEMLEIAAKALSQASYSLENDMTNHAKWFKDVENRCRETLSKSTPSNGMDKKVWARVVPWQGLTEDEMMEIWCSDEVESTLDFGCAIEAELKRKNNG